MTAEAWDQVVRSLTEVHTRSEERLASLAALVSDLTSQVEVLARRLDDVEHEAALDDDPSILDLVGDAIRQLATVDKRVRFLERRAGAPER